MSRIDDHIAALAPDGVELTELGGVGKFIRGNGLQKSDLTDEGAPAIHYGQIHTHYGVSADSTKSFTTPELAARLRRAHPGDLIVVTTSEDDASVAKATAWLGDGEVVVSGDSYIFRHTLDPRYVSYFFQSEHFQGQKKRYITGTKVRRISGDSLAKIRIPVPPLEVQREIVRVLDKFTRLETELEGELEARRRQYEHYRSQLLDGSSGDADVKTVRLDEVCEILVGFPFKSAQFSSGPSDIRLVRGDNVGQGSLKRTEFKRWHRHSSDGLDRYELRADDVVLAMDRPWIPAGLKWARIEDDDLPSLLVQRVARLRARTGILDQKFLGYALSSSRFTEHVLATQTGNTVPHISQGSIAAFRFSLPPLPEQVRRASLLAKFDALVSDLSVGLPAERAARRKQYEYYRDRLLTFEAAA